MIRRVGIIRTKTKNEDLVGVQYVPKFKGYFYLCKGSRFSLDTLLIDVT